MTIEEVIDKLIEQLADADSAEAARIHDRITELKVLKKEKDTT